ncbi:hypothetical protein D8Y20_10780 [Mariprofundus sp. EBB-1]|uniref:hypothetical protein n=1 Tax=Mariprofundus sp. EBB-1 TaxID=2650971 RepID=UPI000EF28A87|nr:hypothetical protein [Mariprofundus sp. EBB-1]RLL50867.1 hypothetical protein D8Y20_10780 [Mariprofundus sp. EBB-1]
MKIKHQFIASLALSTALSIFAVNATAEPYMDSFQNADHKNIGNLNWGSGEINAIGYGVVPPRYANQPARGRAMAIRAAKVDAQRNLLEIVMGTSIKSKTLVKDNVTEGDAIHGQLRSSVLRNASVVGKPHYMDDGLVEVTMAINYRQDIATTLLENYGTKVDRNRVTSMPQAKTSHAAPSEKASPVSGLIIDASGKGLRTALHPRILDEKHHVIYSGSMVSADKQNNIVAYDNSASDASKLPRLGQRTLTIKALKILDKTDVIISNDDAAKIGQAAGMADTLHQARVAFVL